VVKYADNPTARAEVHVAAPPDVVWPLVTDIRLPARFSTELTSAEWAEGTAGPCAGAQFTGHSQHPAVGTWQTTCTVVACEEPRAFGWVVTRLRQWAVLGPGPSGLTPAIEARPDKEERIVARRLAEHEANMRRCLAGIKELAERAR
jgi:hypothetical protein